MTTLALLHGVGHTRSLLRVRGSHLPLARFGLARMAQAGTHGAGRHDVHIIVRARVHYFVRTVRIQYVL